MLRELFSALIVSACCVSVSARAQQATSYPPYSPARSMPQQNFFYQHHSSTAGEGWLRGQADWMRGYGEMYRSLGEGACFFQTARGTFLQNRQMKIELFWDNQDAYTERLVRKYRPERYRKSEEAPVGDNRGRSIRKPKTQLASSTTEATDPKSAWVIEGQIVWPAVLDAPACNRVKAQVEKVLAAQSAGSGVKNPGKTRQQFRAAIDNMLADLKSRIDDMSAAEYQEAKNLLLSLKQDVRVGSSTTSLAGI